MATNLTQILGWQLARERGVAARARAAQRAGLLDVAPHVAARGGGGPPGRLAGCPPVAERASAGRRSASARCPRASRSAARPRAPARPVPVQPLGVPQAARLGRLDRGHRLLVPRRRRRPGAGRGAARVPRRGPAAGLPRLRHPARPRPRRPRPPLLVEALRGAGAPRRAAASGRGAGRRRARRRRLRRRARVPHDWLFPRCAAVVHHAAAGTTATALRAGTPSVARAAQRRPVHLGAAAGRAARLPAADRRAASSRRRRCAPPSSARPRPTASANAPQALAARIRAEDGVARAVAAFERRFGAAPPAPVAPAPATVAGGAP